MGKEKNDKDREKEWIIYFGIVCVFRFEGKMRDNNTNIIHNSVICDVCALCENANHLKHHKINKNKIYSSPLNVRSILFSCFGLGYVRKWMLEKFHLFHKRIYAQKHNTHSAWSG